MRFHRGIRAFVALLFLVSAPYAADTPNPEKLKDEGNDLYRKGKIDEAIEKWRQAIEVDSTYAYAYNNIGIALYDKGDYQGSADYLEKAVALNASYAKAFNSLGNACLALGDYERAQAHYETSIELGPESPEKYTNLGNALSAAGYFGAAVEAYERAIDLDSKHAPAYNNIGVIQQKRGDNEAANESFRNAIKADSRFTDAYVNLGILHFNSGKSYLEVAIDYFERAIDIDKDHAGAQCNYGLALFAQEDYTKAVTHLRRAVKLSPNNPDIHYALGQAYAKRKMSKQAIESFEKALEADPAYENARIAIDYTNEQLRR